MRLTQFSNYAVRTLIYAGLKGHHPSGVPEISRAYGISQNHLNKVAAELCHLGYLEMTRGRTGGVNLRKAPELIGIGEVIRQTESTVSFVECFDEASNTCPLRPVCRFRIALQKALEAFYAELDRHTLADFLENREQLSQYLGISSSEPIGCQRIRRNPEDIGVAAPTLCPASITPTTDSVKEGMT